MNFGLKLTFIGVAFVLLLIVEVAMHEEVHKSIFYDYGINSKIVYNINPFNHEDYVGKTIPLNNQERCDQICEGLHGLTEVITLHITFIMFVGTISVVIYLFFSELREIEMKGGTS